MEILEKGGRTSSLTGSTVSGGAEDLRQNRLTLVIGGFARDTRRQEVIKRVNQALRDLRVDQLTDREPFATRPRTSFVLLKFEERRTETYDQARSRMHEVLSAIVKGRVKLEGQERPMWSGVAKSRAEREKAQHCGRIRAVVRYFDSGRLDQVDSDYAKGTSWLGQFMVGSASEPQPEQKGDVFFVYEDRTDKPWINLTALSGELQSDLTEVQDFLRAPKH